MDVSNPFGDGVADCILTLPSASAASVRPALRPTRGSDVGLGALDVVVAAHAKVVATRQAAAKRATIDLWDVIMGLVMRLARVRYELSLTVERRSRLGSRRQAPGALLGSISVGRMRHRRKVETAVMVVLASAVAGMPVAAMQGWRPAPGATEVRIWPGAAPDAQPVKGPEIAATVIDSAGKPRLVGGKPWTYVDRVSQPTMTVYSPRGNNTGAAVIVFPGGRYFVLEIDLESTEACDCLT